MDFTDDGVALAVARQISTNLMELIYKFTAKSVGECVLQSGLVGRQDTKNLTRLMRAGCLAAHKGILDEADVISKEFKSRMPTTSLS